MKGEMSHSCDYFFLRHAQRSDPGRILTLNGPKWAESRKGVFWGVRIFTFNVYLYLPPKCQTLAQNRPTMSKIAECRCRQRAADNFCAKCWHRLTCSRRTHRIVVHTDDAMPGTNCPKTFWLCAWGALPRFIRAYGLTSRVDRSVASNCA